MKVKMINVYDHKTTIIYSDDRDLLIRNLLEIFYIVEDNNGIVVRINNKMYESRHDEC